MWSFSILKSCWRSRTPSSSSISKASPSYLLFPPIRKKGCVYWWEEKQRGKGWKHFNWRPTKWLVTAALSSHEISTAIDSENGCSGFLNRRLVDFSPFLFFSFTIQFSVFPNRCPWNFYFYFHGIWITQDLLSLNVFSIFPFIAEYLIWNKEECLVRERCFFKKPV